MTVVLGGLKNMTAGSEKRIHIRSRPRGRLLLANCDRAYYKVTGAYGTALCCGHQWYLDLLSRGKWLRAASCTNTRMFLNLYITFPSAVLPLQWLCSHRRLEDEARDGTYDLLLRKTLKETSESVSGKIFPGNLAAKHSYPGLGYRHFVDTASVVQAQSVKCTSA